MPEETQWQSVTAKRPGYGLVRSVHVYHSPEQVIDTFLGTVKVDLGTGSVTEADIAAAAEVEHDRHGININCDKRTCSFHTIKHIDIICRGYKRECKRILIGGGESRGIGSP